MLRASPTRLRLKPRTVEELSFYMRNTLNEEKPKDRFEDVEKEGIKAAVQEPAWTARYSMGLVRMPARHRHRQENLHESVLVGSPS